MVTRVGFKSFSQDPEQKSVWLLRVSTFGDDEVDVVLSEVEQVRIVRMLQSSFLERRASMSAHPNYPTFSITNANVAHGTQSSGLLIDTAEIGSMVATFNNSMAEHLKGAIDDVIAANEARKGKN